MARSAVKVSSNTQLRKNLEKKSEISQKGKNGVKKREKNTQKGMEVIIKSTIYKVFKASVHAGKSLYTTAVNDLQSLVCKLK